MLLRLEEAAGRRTAARADTGEPFGPLVDRVLATPSTGVDVGVEALAGVRAGEVPGAVDGLAAVALARPLEGAPLGGGFLVAPDILGGG